MKALPDKNRTGNSHSQLLKKNQVGAITYIYFKRKGLFRNFSTSSINMEMTSTRTITQVKHLELHQPSIGQGNFV